VTTVPTERPGGYRLVVPPGWYRIDSDEGRRPRDVHRFVADQFAGTDHLPQVRRQLEASLVDHVAKAAEEGALEMYLSALRVGPVPVSSSLVVSFLPGPGLADEPDEEDLKQMLLLAARQEAEGVVADARLLTWDDGWAVRRVVHRQAPTGDDDLGQQLGPAPTFGVDWFRPVPGTRGATLLLAFSSPLLPVEEQLTELFDTIAGTLTWT
jgi:hypothetical protein